MSVVPFVGRDADFHEDLCLFENWLKGSVPWSDDKNHYLHLVAQVAENEGVPILVRRKAAQLIYEYSDQRKVVEKLLSVPQERAQQAVDEWLYGE